MKVEIDLREIKIVPENDEERLIVLQHGGSTAPMHLWLKFPLGTPGLVGVNKNAEAVWEDFRYHEAVFRAIADGKDVMEALQEVDKTIKAEEADEKAEEEANEKVEDLVDSVTEPSNIDLEYETVRQEDGTYKTIVYLLPLTTDVTNSELKLAMTRDLKEKVLTNPTSKDLEVAIEEVAKEIAAKKAEFPPKKKSWFNW